MSEFWKGQYNTSTVGLDGFLGDTLGGKSFRTVRNFVGPSRLFEAGARVAFDATLEAQLTYTHSPDAEESGTILKVRTAHGDLTQHEDMVFVRWDKSGFIPVFSNHIKVGNAAKHASNYRRVVGSLGDLTAFFTLGSSEKTSDLVHKATKDFWSVRQQGDNFVIERLFDANGEPLRDK